MSTESKETISLPRKSVAQLGKIFKDFELAQNDIEDFLISQNKSIVGEIKNARKEHSKKKVKDFSVLLKKYV